MYILTSAIFICLFLCIFERILFYTIREGFKKKIKKMVGLIHRCWLAGVSLGPKFNQKKIVFKKNTKMIRMV